MSHTKRVERVLQLHHHLDAWKAASAVFLAALISITHSWSSHTAGALFVMWAGYSTTWLIKSHSFPDNCWRLTASVADGVAFWTVMSLYFSGTVMTIVKHAEAPPPVVTASLFCNLLGIFLLYVTDMQRYTHLKLKPGDLINDGMFKFVRNPNYIGEALIYLGFVGPPSAALHTTWLLIYHALIVGVLYVPKMLEKDAKLAQIESGDWQSYKKRSSLFVPFTY